MINMAEGKEEKVEEKKESPKIDQKTIGSIVVGAVILAVAVWMLLTLTNPTGRYLGGIIVAIIGIATIVKPFLKKK